MAHIVYENDENSLLVLKELVSRHNNSGQNIPSFYNGSRRPSSYHKAVPGQFPYQIICGKCKSLCNLVPNGGYVDLVVCIPCDIRYYEK